jgi:MFS family permease
MAVEHGHEGRRGLYASWVQAGVPAGSLLATAIFNLVSHLPEVELLRWGWRIPFLLGFALLGIGLFIRLQILESPLFAQARDRKEPAGMPLLVVLKRYPKNILLAIGARLAENASFYIFTVFVLTYATSALDLPRTLILDCLLVASSVQFFAIPVFGLLSDSVGRRPVYMGGAIALAAFAFPFFWLLDTKDEALVALAITIGLIVVAAMYAPQAAFFSELFGTEVRYTGASIGYQLASPLAGGIAPLISVALLKWGDGRPAGVAVYLIVLSAITLLSVWLAAETHRSRLDDSGNESHGGGV